MIVILTAKATDEDIKNSSEEYKTYIKVTMDIEKEIVALGGEYHYDAEQQLLKMGCTQTNIWGGGIDLVSKRIDTNAIINIRGKQNYSTEICDEEVKLKFIQLTKHYLESYVKE